MANRSTQQELVCNACNKRFNDDADQRLHYKSEWHRYNLKRKVAGAYGVREELFLARQSALAEEKKLIETPMLYSCGHCGKSYKSSKAHAQHLKSRTHILRASQGQSDQDEETTIIKPLKQHEKNKVPQHTELGDGEGEESGDEWVEVDQEEYVANATKSLTGLTINEPIPDDEMNESEVDDDEFVDLDPLSCFMCDRRLDNLNDCIVHLHKHHGFFIPDVEYLKDPKGLVIYLGLKVKRDFMCLYCNENCHPFSSLEAVRKHMEAKSHCKIHYGDGGEDEEVDLEEFYDYSSSYADVDGKQLVAQDDMNNTVEIGSGGSELIITTRSNDRILTRTLGSREYLRYYRQKPRPSLSSNLAIAASLASRYRSMGLATVQSREQVVRMKVLKQMNKSGVESMRSKIGMKSNVIRNLPKNVPH